MQVYPFEAVKPGDPMESYSPAISAYTMAFHHEGIYGDHVKRLNELVSRNAGLKNVPLTRLTSSFNDDVRYHAGGVYNHWVYFSRLSSSEKKVPEVLQKRIDACFGSFDRLMERLLGTADDLRGAGYVWLCEDRSHRLRIGVTTQQNTPDLSAMNPLICCDVWEHAYYLDRQNRRREYLTAWSRLIDWEKAASQLGQAGG